MSEEVKTDGALVKDGEVKETSGVQWRTNSPYDLSSSDNMGSVISQPLLRGLNYDE